MQFSRLKEELLRASHEALGERYLHGRHRPRRDAAGSCASRRCFASQVPAEIADEVLTLRVIYDEHEGVRDRFSGAGAVDPELAARLGLTGLAGRASGQAFDLRCDFPCEPYARAVSEEDCSYRR